MGGGLERSARSGWAAGRGRATSPGDHAPLHPPAAVPGTTLSAGAVMVVAVTSSYTRQHCAQNSSALSSLSLHPTPTPPGHYAQPPAIAPCQLWAEGAATLTAVAGFESGFSLATEASKVAWVKPDKSFLWAPALALFATGSLPAGSGIVTASPLVEGTCFSFSQETSTSDWIKL